MRPCRLYHDGDGYAFLCVRRNGRKYHLYEHRVLEYARGNLDSVFFSEDAREVHHDPTVPKWLNIEDAVETLTPWEHIDVDPERAKIPTPWNGVGAP